MTQLAPKVINITRATLHIVFGGGCRRRVGKGGVLESFSVTENPLLILASNSPRRRQLLTLTGWKFDVLAADVDESEYPNESPTDYVLRLAETKARAFKADADQIILAADTTVVDG